MLGNQLKTDNIPVMRTWSFYPNYIMYRLLREHGSAKYVKRIVRLVRLKGMSVEQAENEYYDYFPNLGPSVLTTLNKDIEVKENPNYKKLVVKMPGVDQIEEIKQIVKELRLVRESCDPVLFEDKVKERLGVMLLDGWVKDAIVNVDREDIEMHHAVEFLKIGMTTYHNYELEPEWDVVPLIGRIDVRETRPKAGRITMSLMVKDKEETKELYETRDSKSLRLEIASLYIYRYFNSDGSLKDRTHRRMINLSRYDGNRGDEIWKIGNVSVKERRTQYSTAKDGRSWRLRTVIVPQQGSLSIVLKFKSEGTYKVKYVRKSDYDKVILHINGDNSDLAINNMAEPFEQVVNDSVNIRFVPMEDFYCAYEVVVEGFADMLVIEQYVECSIKELDPWYLREMTDARYEHIQRGRTWGYRVVTEHIIYDLSDKAARLTMRQKGNVALNIDSNVFSPDVARYFRVMLLRLRDELIKYQIRGEGVEPLEADIPG